MYGNPVATRTDNYRLFVIYHLKSLKALDGTAIVSAFYAYYLEFKHGMIFQVIVETLNQYAYYLVKRRARCQVA